MLKVVKYLKIVMVELLNKITIMLTTFQSHFKKKTIFDSKKNNNNELPLKLQNQNYRYTY